MKILLELSILLLFGGGVDVYAATYKWTDDRGVIHFTDSAESIPTKFRNQVSTRADITIRNPKVREELKEQELRASEDMALPRINPASENNMPAQKPIQQIAPTAPGTDELPRGRTKSQRIEDNIKRRTAE